MTGPGFQAWVQPNGGLVQVHIEVGSLAVIQQAKIAVKAKVIIKTLKGIDLKVGMDCRAMQANLKCGQAVCVVQLQGKTKKLRPSNNDGHILSCSEEQLKDAGKTKVLSPKQASSQAVEARRSKLAHARAKGSVYTIHI